MNLQDPESPHSSSLRSSPIRNALLEFGKGFLDGLAFLFKGPFRALDSICKGSTKDGETGDTLNCSKDSWHSQVPADVLLQRVYHHFKNNRIGTSKYCWRSIQPRLESKQLVFETFWHHENVAENGWDNETRIDLTVTFNDESDGRSCARVQYTQSSNNLANLDPFADQLIRNTKTWIKAICAQPAN